MSEGFLVFRIRPFVAVLALVLLRCPYSFIIAAIWNVTDES
jgi:hypothetical protein